jgi:hypothetical protein
MAMSDMADFVFEVIGLTCIISFVLVTAFVIGDCLLDRWRS